MTAWTNEQIAAFTGGELDASAADALRAEVARDPGLATRVAQQRRVDELLAGLQPPTPDPAFSTSLRTTTAAAVRQVTGDSIGFGRSSASPAAAARVLPPDSDISELASRRARREAPAWTRFALGSAAAVLVLVVGIGVVGGFSGFGGGSDDSADTAAMDTSRGLDSSDDSSEAMDDMAMEDEAMEQGATAEEALDPTAPLVLDLDEDFDDEALARLAGDVRDRVGSVDPGRAFPLAEENTLAYGLTPAPAGGSAASTSTEDAAGDESDESDEPDGDAQLFASRGPVEAFDLATEDARQVTTCLAPLLAASTPDRALIPVEARLGTRDGGSVITYFLLALDEDTGQYSRVETWVVDRDTCEVIEFLPG